MLAIYSYMSWYHAGADGQLDYYPKPASLSSVH
jgi:hypothetical protein